MHICVILLGALEASANANEEMDMSLAVMPCGGCIQLVV